MLHKSYRLSDTFVVFLTFFIPIHFYCLEKSSQNILLNIFQQHTWETFLYACSYLHQNGLVSENIFGSVFSRLSNVRCFSY